MWQDSLAASGYVLEKGDCVSELPLALATVGLWLPWPVDEARVLGHRPVQMSWRRQLGEQLSWLAHTRLYGQDRHAACCEITKRLPVRVLLRQFAALRSTSSAGGSSHPAARLSYV